MYRITTMLYKSYQNFESTFQKIKKKKLIIWWNLVKNSLKEVLHFQFCYQFCNLHACCPKFLHAYVDVLQTGKYVMGLTHLYAQIFWVVWINKFTVGTVEKSLVALYLGFVVATTGLRWCNLRKTCAVFPWAMYVEALSCWNQQWYLDGSNNVMNCCTISRYFLPPIVLQKKKKQLPYAICWGWTSRPTSAPT